MSRAIGNRKKCSNSECGNKNKDRNGFLRKKHFYKWNLTKDGLSSKCKYCGKQYYLRNIRKITKYKSKWYKLNKNGIAIRHKERHAEISKYLKKYIPKYWKKNRKRLNKKIRDRRNTDIQFKLRCRLRTRLSQGLRYFKASKKVSSVKDLGCSMPEFSKYLESKWLPRMSWKNYGNKKDSWSLDHIKALANFDLTKKSEQQKAVHFTNLQPMWHLDNIRKADN